MTNHYLLNRQALLLRKLYTIQWFTNPNIVTDLVQEMSSIHSDSITRPSLILRAQNQQDKAAWDEFVNRYGPRVTTWSRRWCKQDADVKDLSQDILFHIWRKLPQFRREEGKKFRGWLRKVSQHAFVDSGRRRKSVIIEGGVVEGEMDKRALALSRAMERQLDEELLQMACLRVREIVKPDQWEMFEQTNLLQTPPNDVAKQFNKSVDAVRMNSVRIRKLIKTKIKEIEESIFA